MAGKTNVGKISAKMKRVALIASTGNIQFKFPFDCLGSRAQAVTHTHSSLYAQQQR